MGPRKAFERPDVKPRGLQQGENRSMGKELAWNLLTKEAV